jgi:hypothetical protein
MFQKKFLDATPEQRVELVAKIAAKEKKPATPEEHFFVTLKAAVVRGYYSSKIGIHDEMDYKGNTYQQGDYAGELPHA